LGTLPFITGNERNYRFEKDVLLNNVKPFDEDISDLKPDVFHGAALSDIHPRVRADLGGFIIPSTADTTRPAAPNFFLEGKGAKGTPYVARNQVVLDCAVGARAMHQLQNYGAKEPNYDKKGTELFCGLPNGHLQLYATHVTKPLTPGGNPEYHLTQLKAYAMTSDKEAFLKGATAYRSSRDLAKKEQDISIAHANEAARHMPAPSLSASSTSRISSSTVVVAGLDAFEDELARDEVTTVKRPRQSATLAA
jgi:hypothetical protein